MKRTTLKSSALLIAIIVGMVLMVLIVGVSLIVSQHSRSAGQSRDGKIAYRAALSGIEDGLLRYQFARANNQLSKIFGDLGKNIPISTNARGPKASYDLSIGLSSLSVGNPLNLLDPALKQKISMDNPIDINLSAYNNLDKIYISFTKPYQFDALGNEQPVFGSFTAMNIKLINTNATAEQQQLDEQTNTVSSNGKLLEDKVVYCIKGTECHLRIRPQFATSLISSDARRIAGSKDSKGKFVYIAIEAFSGANRVDNPSTDKPGTILITSIGNAGEARRKLEAKIDAGSGAYLGLFDWGVYCGEGCNWGTKGI